TQEDPAEARLVKALNNTEQRSSTVVQANHHVIHSPKKHPTHWPHRPSREAWRESQLLPRQRITAPYRFARSKPQGSIGSQPITVVTLIIPLDQWEYIIVQ
ncbi:unnamed protein product, partial [Heterosigma akashiwo]